MTRTTTAPRHPATPSARTSGARRSLAALGLALAAASSALSCGGAEPPAPPPGVPLNPPMGSAPRATVEGETPEAFVKRVDADLRRLWTRSARAAWIAQTYINEDSKALSAAAEEESMEYLSKMIPLAAKLSPAGASPEVARQLSLLKLASSLPAPRDAGRRARLAALSVEMPSHYGEATYCPAGPAKPAAKGKATKDEPKKCLTLGDLSNILAKSRKYDELLDAWKGWHDTATPNKARFAEYVELGNEGAREIGFADVGALWRSGYDMSPEAFEAETDRLWGQVKPLYDELHCHVRARLRKLYGKDKVPEAGAIPAHLLGNMWAQEWGALYDLVEPHKGAGSLDVTKSIQAKKLDAKKMVGLAEGFFVSLGMDPLPDTFWKRSMLTRPRDREVVCHASAWDVTLDDDLRIKMCIEPKEDDLVTIHHELGHNYYYHYYHELPVLFQAGANDGFHEGIGDTIALSVTPQYLAKIGLLAKAPQNEKAELNFLMKMALDKVAFLPFGKLVDQWRWDVFAGKTMPASYNRDWWALRLKYQGVAPPTSRGEDVFDAGAKYHVPANTPYTRYFLARIYQFQFHRALCKVAGHQGPLHTCSIYESKAAGEKLKAMLAMGASKPWPEALAAISGERQADATAMLDYFAPLVKYLREQNKGEKCGW